MQCCYGRNPFIMCEAAFQINERQWAVKELHPEESPCTFVLMHSIIADLISHKIWILWEQMRALNSFNFHWHGCNNTSCSELLGSHKPKAEKKLTHQNYLIFVMALCYAQMKTCLSQMEWILPERKYNGLTPIFVFTGSK